MPRGLGRRDVKEAFEAEAGRVAKCEVRSNEAKILFHRSVSARKAVDIFNQGELNGRTIGVKLL